MLMSCQPMSKQPLLRLQQSVDGAYAGHLSNDGKYSIISSIYHGVSVWDIKTKQRLYNWAQEQNSSDNLVLSIDISNNPISLLGKIYSAPLILHLVNL